jgi:hypothetical protein
MTETIFTELARSGPMGIVIGVLIWVSYTLYRQMRSDVEKRMTDSDRMLERLVELNKSSTAAVAAAAAAATACKETLQEIKGMLRG